MALSQPINTSVVGNVNSYADLYAAFNAGNLAAAQAVGGALPSVVAIDTAGKLTPAASRDIQADTFQQAASDFLDWISLAAVPDGMTVSIAPANAARKVVLRHAMTTSDADAGTLLLASGAAAGDQLVLDATTKSVVLQRHGIGFYERERHGFLSSGSTIGTAAQDFGGYPVTGMRVGFRQVAAATDTLDRAADKGWMKQYAAAATVSLPDPNDQTNADPTRWWQAGDMVLWEARASSLLFRRWDGAVPANALGHDRASGSYAQGWVVVSPNPATGSLEWVLTGVTAGPPSGGSTQRTAFWTSGLADKTLASTDTAVNTAASLAYPFGANEKWVHLACFGFYGAGTSGGSLAVATAVMQGTSDVEVAHTLRPRYATGKEMVTFLWGNTFGASAGSQTIRLDAKNQASGNQTVVERPFLLALRLETDENYVTDAGPHTDSAGTLTAAATLAYSGLPSDEYEILYGAEVTDDGGRRIDCQISVNGTVESPVTTQRAATRPGWYSGVTSFTLSGSGSIVLQFRRNPGETAGTVTATNATIVLLRKGRFQQVDSAKSAAAQTFNSSTFASKASKNVSLVSGWSTLVIGGAQGLTPTSDGADLALGRFSQNAGLIVPQWAADANTAGLWNGTSCLASAVVTPATASDVLDLSFASADNSSSVQVEGACFVALALKPAG